MSGFNYDSYLPRVRQAESSGNDAARNPRSSAEGRFQFIDSTFLNYGRRLYPGLSDQQIMAKKMDPQVQEQAMRAFTDDNVGVLSKAGIPVNNGSVYGAHHFGPGGATKLYQADPNADVASVLGPQVVDANPHLRGMTVGQTQQWLARKGGDGSEIMAGGSGSPQMAGDSGMDTLQPPQDQGMLAGLLGPGDGQSWNAGDALIGAGVAAMARDNPAGAAALARNMGSTRDKRQPRAMQTQYDPKTGRLIKIDPTTGKVEVQELGAPPKEEEKISPETIRKEAETFATNDQSLDRVTSLVERGNKIREAIKDGRLSTDMLSQLISGAKRLTNTSDEQTRLLDDLETYKRELANFQLSIQKGVQTEGDATRIMAQLFPAGSTFDNGSVINNIDKIAEASLKDANRFAGSNKDILARTNKVKADGGTEWLKTTDERIKSLKEWDERIRTTTPAKKTEGPSSAPRKPVVGVKASNGGLVTEIVD